MDMSKSSEYRINEVVNLMKIWDEADEDDDIAELQEGGVQLKIKNPYMLIGHNQEGFYVPHMLTHQEYVYMMEHLEELWGGESSPVPAPVPGPDSGK